MNYLVKRIQIILTIYIATSSLSFAKITKTNIYLVKYPPYNISSTEGVGPYLLRYMNKYLENYKLNLVYLPGRRLIRLYSQGELPILFHTVSHISKSVKNKTKLLPMVNLKEMYAYTNPKVLNKLNPTLGYFQGDTEEKNFIGSDKYKRIELATPKSMYSMLISGRIDFINCLVPMCLYLDETSSLKFIKKPKGLQDSLGGILIHDSLKDKKIIHELELAFQKMTQEKDFKQRISKYIKKYRLKYLDIFPKEFYSKEFINLDKPYIYKY